MQNNQKTEHFRYRLTYSRDAAACWIAHLDMMRLFQRTLKRANLPMAYTQGYNPRPIMEFALPIGVGIETRNEPFDIVLTKELQAELLTFKINEKLPKGLAIVSAERLADNVKNLMSKVQNATYRISASQLGDLVDMYYLDSRQDFLVERIRKDKLRIFNIRDYILSLQVLDQHTVLFTCKAGSADNLRPDLFLKAFQVKGLLTEEDALNSIIIREAVGLRGALNG